MKTPLTTRTLVVAGALLVVGCPSSSEHDDHVTSPSEIADAATAEDATDDGGDSGRADAVADAALCAPPCTAAEVCCTDAHGHFPTCKPGGRCP